jgi:hypothetical protein
MINTIQEESSLSSPFGTIMMALPGLLNWFWKLIREITKKYSRRGMYEVLDFQTKLTIHDPKGKNATLTKYEKVRFLQGNIIAYQDQAWGDGRILQNYRCSPGVPVDFYRTGYKTYVLISLRTLKNKGDITEFNFQWKMKDCFIKPTGFWGTDICQSTDHVRVQVVFPKSRPPKKAEVIEKNFRRTKVLGVNCIQQLPNEKWLLTWEHSHPSLYEQYILKWDW